MERDNNHRGNPLLFSKIHSETEYFQCDTLHAKSLYSTVMHWQYSLSFVPHDM